MDNNYKTLRKVLYNAPGPSPWYLRGRDPQVSYQKNKLSWVDAGNHDPFSGKICLQEKETVNLPRTLLLLDFYCLVYPFPPENLLIISKMKKNNSLRLIFLTVSQLKPILNLKQACLSMKEKKDAVFAETSLDVYTDIALNLKPGENRVDFLSPFSNLPELFILEDSTYGQSYMPKDSQTSPHLALFDIKPLDKTIRVVMQDWFNKGAYDFGYQWPTRIARDPESGKLFGEGIRLGAFILNNENNQVETWLKEDPFYGPGSLKPDAVQGER